MVDAEAAPRSLLLVGTVCALNASMSIALISFNKYLMHEDRFPYPMPLVTGHCAVSSILIFGMWLLHRCFGDANPGSGFFSSLEEGVSSTSAFKQRISIISLFYALQLVATNAAYLFSSMVFIQMMKEANIAFVYLASIAVALEAPSVHRFKALCLIVFATYLTIKGELNFTWFGFCVQGAGQLFEVGRIVLQALLLCGSAKLDVFTYVLFVAPISGALLGGFLLFNASLSQPLEFVTTPAWSVVVEWWPALLLNALLAFALTMTTTLTVKYANAMGLIFTGVIKDTMIIVFGSYFFGEKVTIVQAIGFSLQLCGIVMYSMIKLYPERFEWGILHGLNCWIVPPTVKRASLSGKRYGSMPFGTGSPAGVSFCSWSTACSQHRV